MIYLLSFLAYEFKSEFNAQSNIGLEFGVIFYFPQCYLFHDFVPKCHRLSLDIFRQSVLFLLVLALDN